MKTNCCHRDMIIDEQNESKKLKGHTHPICTVYICERKDLLFTGSYDGKMKIWNLQDNTLLKTYDIGDFVQIIVVSKQGDLLAIGGNFFGRIDLMEISYLNLDSTVQHLDGHVSKVLRLNFSNDENYLISSSKDKTIRVWYVQSRQELYKYELDSCPFGVAINNDNKFISSGSTEGVIKIWNFQSQKLLCSKGSHIGETEIAFLSNQQMLISKGKDGVKMWNLKQMHKDQLQLIKKFHNDFWIKEYALLTVDFRFIITYNPNNRYLSVIDTTDGNMIYQSKFVKFYPGNDEIVGISIRMNSLVYFYGGNIIVQKLS